MAGRHSLHMMVRTTVRRAAEPLLRPCGLSVASAEQATLGVLCKPKKSSCA